MEGTEENKKKGKLRRRFYQQRFFPTAEKTGLTDYRSVIQYIYDAGTYAYGKGESEKPSSDAQKQEKATSSTLAKETLRLRNTAVLNLKLKQKIFAYEKERLRKLRVILPPDPVDAPPEDEDVVVKKEKDPFKLPKFKWPKPPRKPPTNPPTTPPPPAPVTPPSFEFDFPWWIFAPLAPELQRVTGLEQPAVASAQQQGSRSIGETLAESLAFSKRYSQSRSRSGAAQSTRSTARSSSRSAARTLARELAEGGSGTSRSGSSATATATRTGKGSGTGTGTGQGPFAQSRPNKGGSSPTGPGGPPKLPTLKIGGYEIGGFSERIPKDVAERLAKDLKRLKVKGFTAGTLAELRAALPAGYVIEGFEKAQSKIVPGPGGPVVTNLTGEALEEALKKLDKPKAVKVDPAKILGQLDKSTQTTADVISKTSKSPIVVKPTASPSVVPKPTFNFGSAIKGLGGRLIKGGPNIIANIIVSTLLDMGVDAAVRKLDDVFYENVSRPQREGMFLDILNKGKQPEEIIEKLIKRREYLLKNKKFEGMFGTMPDEQVSKWASRMDDDIEFLRSQAPRTGGTRRDVYDFGIDLPPTNTVRGQHYGASRDGGTRDHAGIDFDISGDQTFATQIGGVVTGIRTQNGGYGLYVDIYNEKFGVTERIAEGRQLVPGIKVGMRVKAGKPIVMGESSTGVIHYEIRQGGGLNVAPTYGFEGTQDPMEFLKKNVPKPKDVNIKPDRKVGQKATLKGKPVKWDGEKWIPDVPPEQKVSVLPINKDTTVDQDPILDQNVNFDVASFKIPALTPQVEYIPVPVPMPESSKSIASVQNSPAWGNTSLLGA